MSSDSESTSLDSDVESRNRFEASIDLNFAVGLKYVEKKNEFVAKNTTTITSESGISSSMQSYIASKLDDVIAGSIAFVDKECKHTSPATSSENGPVLFKGQDKFILCDDVTTNNVKRRRKYKKCSDSDSDDDARFRAVAVDANWVMKQALVINGLKGENNIQENYSLTKESEQPERRKKKKDKTRDVD